MTLNDPELKKIVTENKTVTIIQRDFKVQPSPGMVCDGCYFHNKEYCPPKATQICTSNSGNVLIEIKK